MSASLFRAFVSLCTVLVVGGCSRPTKEVVEVTATSDLPDASPIHFSDSDWPWWRGPDRNNVARCDQVVTSWSDTENVLWKAKVPGRGHSTPTVVGDRVFLATADERDQTQSVVCLDRSTGDSLWTTQVHAGNLPPNSEMHPKSTHANGSVACDGSQLFVAFLNGEQVTLTSLSLEGDIRWQTPVGYFVAKFGYAPSPCVFDRSVIVSGDNRGGSFLTAVHRDTGDVIWKKARDNQDTYSSAVVADIRGTWQLLLSGNRKVSSYDPATGALNWQTEGTAQATCGTIVWKDRLIYASGGYPERQTVCIDATDGTLIWQDKLKCYEQSMLVVGDYLYAITDDAIAVCRDAATGELKWRSRLSGSFSASPLLVGNLIYATNESGTTWVFDASPEGFSQVGKNQLGSSSFASLVACDGKLYARVATGERNDRQEYVYCLGP
ncbi:MAG: PQQ-binding-like beta-propeller repeat protein [Planctomycetaceae bacterium]|nr:PQQ-binding-like beta-propeller repeat protein [Planctomycetaceae bacterium]